MSLLTPDRPPPEADLWQRAIAGDRDAFEQAVASYQEVLMAAAERQVDVQRATGELREDALNPTELVGETLVRAYEHRIAFDADQMSFRAWLLGVQHRALTHILHQEHRYAGRKAISLNDEVAESASRDAVGEALYEFRQPFEVVTYGDLIAGSQPIDVEFDPDGNEPLTDDEQRVLESSGLSPEARETILLHDEFDLSLSEVAQILDASLKDTAESLNLARASIRQRFGSDALPADARDDHDSYTGDPVP